MLVEAIEGVFYPRGYLIPINNIEGACTPVIASAHNIISFHINIQYYIKTQAASHQHE